MKIFYIPITNKISLRNYENSVVKRVNFENKDITDITNNCGVWGFKNGESNKRNYEAMERGDIVFFRINDDENYQCFSGFAKISDKQVSYKLSKIFWQDTSYENIIFFSELIIFDKPFRLSKNSKKLSNLNFGKIWHDGYNMFREWKLKSDDEEIKKTEDLINFFLNIKHKIIYKLEENIENIEINEDELEIDNITELEREAIIKARIGQSKLRDQLFLERKKCELCGINKKELLIASHIKPWSKSKKNEKLDLNNVFLFCSTHDNLFDKGFISFDNNGLIMISDELDEVNRVFSNINFNMKIDINEKMKKYLEYHRKYIFKFKK